MTARERLLSVLRAKAINDIEFLGLENAESLVDDPESMRRLGNFADAILEIVPGLCEVCGHCDNGQKKYSARHTGPCIMCNGEGIRIKQDRQEREDGST